MSYSSIYGQYVKRHIVKTLNNSSTKTITNTYKYYKSKFKSIFDRCQISLSNEQQTNDIVGRKRCDGDPSDNDKRRGAHEKVNRASTPTQQGSEENEHG